MDITSALRLIAELLETVGLHSSLEGIKAGYIVLISHDDIDISDRLLTHKIYFNSDGDGNYRIIRNGEVMLTVSLADASFSSKVVQAYADIVGSFPRFPIKLPQMQEMLFAPWFPLAHPNLLYDGRCRDDLPDDAQVHEYNGGHWTLEELKEYGALPALPPKDMA